MKTGAIWFVLSLTLAAIGLTFTNTVVLQNIIISDEVGNE
jgi:hypothetical protein